METLHCEGFQTFLAQTKYCMGFTWKSLLQNPLICMTFQVWNLTTQTIHFNVTKLLSSATYLGATKWSECPIQQKMLIEDFVDLLGSFPSSKIPWGKQGYASISLRISPSLPTSLYFSESRSTHSITLVVRLV